MAHDQAGGVDVKVCHIGHAERERRRSLDCGDRNRNLLQIFTCRPVGLRTAFYTTSTFGGLLEVVPGVQKDRYTILHSAMASRCGGAPGEMLFRTSNASRPEEGIRPHR